jgi:predicted RNase H-like HicB family nuclease
MELIDKVEFVFENQPEGGFYAYAPDLPGLHTQGETLEEALLNAQEALTLYVEDIREAGELVASPVIRRMLSIPA